MRLSIFLPLILILFGCSHATPPTPTADSTDAAQPVHDGDALTKEEKLVKACILDNADDPKSVEFSRWGPNVTWADYFAAQRTADAANFASWKKQDDQERAKWEQGKKEDDAAASKAKAAHLEYANTYPAAYLGWPPPGRLADPKSEHLVDMIVRARYRSANKRGAKELHDELFYVKGSQGMTWLPDMGSDHWFEAHKALWVAAFAPVKK